ncbi:MAG: DUF5615 family PIN-like protein [Acidobacteria bacterium]|nr:DUF5615 family PIN-like protein [Acidobacteriota bacterium]
MAQRARTEHRILITNDRDFGELVYLRGETPAGVLLMRFATELDEHNKESEIDRAPESATFYYGFIRGYGKDDATPVIERLQPARHRGALPAIARAARGPYELGGVAMSHSHGRIRARWRSAAISRRRSADKSSQEAVISAGSARGPMARNTILTPTASRLEKQRRRMWRAVSDESRDRLSARILR